MREPIDILALYDALGPEDRAEVERALTDNPALADAFERWRSLRATVRRELAEALPDRALLVLYALADETLPGETAPGSAADLLDAREHQRLDGARDDLRALLTKHPGLVDAVRRIRDDRDAFERIWAAHTEQNGVAPSERPAPARAADRPQLAPVRVARRRSPVWRVAALASVVAFAAILTFLVRRDAGWETVRVAEATTIDLPDGSTAELAANTWLMIPEGEADLRQVRLRAGHALFTVRHDPSAPFTVETPNALVTVLGTTFGVDVMEAETDVVLVNGAVALASRADADQAVRLEPGQRSQVLALNAPSEPARADLDAALAWTGDVFVPSESLARMALRLSDAFGEPVEVDAALADEQLSATHFEREAGLEAALQELALALGAQVVEQPEGGFRIEAAP